MSDANTFRIGIELGHLVPEGSALGAAAFPNLAFAVQQLTEEAHRRWVAYASGAPLPTGQVIQNRTGTYARSILMRRLGDFSGEVYSELPYAEIIENGAPSRDLKKILGYSYKVRVSEEGKRYLIIPFRWNHPNSVLGRQMPQPVADWWAQGRTPSHVVGMGTRTSGTGAYDIKTRGRLVVPLRKYVWGARLSKNDLEGMGIRGAQANRLAGMVNFRKAGAKGGGSHSQFMTFRVMVEGSKGWIAPAIEGKHPARTVAEQLRPIADTLFKKAMQEDVKALLPQE